MTAFAIFIRQLQREWLLVSRQKHVLLPIYLFYFFIMIFFTLLIPPDPTLLRWVCPGIIWIGLLFALFLGTERLFTEEFKSGIIEQWLVCGYSPTLYVLAKLSVFWIITVIPLCCMTPLIALFFNLTLVEGLNLFVSVLCSSPTLLLLCGFAAVFQASAEKGTLLALLVFPLTIPVMIFGTEGMLASMQGLPMSGHLALLGALILLSIITLPFAIGQLIKTILN